MTRQYFERQIQSLDELVKHMKESPDKEIAKVYAVMAKDRLQFLYWDAVEIDYESYYKKIKPYLK